MIVGGIAAAIFTERIAEELLNEPIISLRFTPILTEVNPLQLRNAYLPMLVMELGSEMEVSPVHFSKAEAPIEIMPSGMVNDVIPVQPMKDSSLIRVTESPMVRLVSVIIFLNGATADDL